MHFNWNIVHPNSHKVLYKKKKKRAHKNHWKSYGKMHYEHYPFFDLLPSLWLVSNYFRHDLLTLQHGITFANIQVFVWLPINTTDIGILFDAKIHITLTPELWEAYTGGSQPLENKMRSKAWPRSQAKCICKICKRSEGS